MPHLDQKIEERESLRHSTHRSQRSDRAAGNVLGGAGGPITGQGHATASDRFGQTDQFLQEGHDRPAFQKASNQYNMEGDQEAHEAEQRYIEQQAEG